MDAAVCDPAKPALWWQAILHRPTSPIERALSAEPKSPMCTHPYEHGPSDLLFAYAELRSYPTPCCLHDGCIGLIASLLLAVLSHRLADALGSTDRVTTPRSWPSLEACALGRSLSTPLHRDPSSAHWLQATSSSHSAPLRASSR
jgi:hypothetical protein